MEYSLRAIPLGGYVGFPDDDPESPYPPDDPDLLRNKVRSLSRAAGLGCLDHHLLRAFKSIVIPVVPPVARRNVCRC